jgi:hypothetical protein
MAAGDKRVDNLGVLIKKLRYGGRHTLTYRVLRLWPAAGSVWA